MTSNIGSREVLNHRSTLMSKLLKKLGTYDEKKIWTSSLNQYFDPEFLNRIDTIHYFNDLGRDVFDEIVEIEIQKLNNRLKSRGISVALTKNAKNRLSEYEDYRYGARGIERSVRNHIEPIVADYILNHKIWKPLLTIDSRDGILMDVT